MIRVSPEGTVEPGAVVSIVDPGVPIPAGAAAVHGITTERARAEGVPPADAIRAAAPLLLRCRNEGTPLVIYNAPFDWPLLMAESSRHGVPLPAGVPLLDPLLLDRHFDRYRRGSRRLTDVATHYGVRLDAAHSAEADAVATAAIARALVAAFPSELAHLSVVDLQVRQARWYAAWRDGINDYWQRRGDPRRNTTDWPVGA